MQPKPDRAAWLKGPQAQCTHIGNPAKPQRLILLGAPGVGKGTQAELLSQRLGACHLSTGDVFRAAKSLSPAERTPTMNRAIEYMVRGDLVPDEIVLGLVAERSGCLRCPSGFLLDGFPRTVFQAEELDKLLVNEKVAIGAVLSYDMPIDQIVARLSGRRTCSKCKAVYHVETKPSKKEGICDQCGGSLYLREDDKPETIRVRMEAYAKSTAPLADYYQRKGLLVSILAEGTPEEIFQRTMEVLDKR